MDLALIWQKEISDFLFIVYQFDFLNKSILPNFMYNNHHCTVAATALLMFDCVFMWNNSTDTYIGWRLFAWLHMFSVKIV